MDTANGCVRVWDLPLRLFHWALVMPIAVAFLSSEEARSEVPRPLSIAPMGSLIIL